MKRINLYSETDGPVDMKIIRAVGNHEKERRRERLNKRNKDKQKQDRSW